MFGIGSKIQRVATFIRRVGSSLLGYKINSKTPDLVADFNGSLNDGTEFYDAGGTVDSFAELITHSRAGNATMTDGYGPELVTNGGFDSDSDWTVTGTASISGGKARINSPSGELAEIYQNGVLEVGKTYILEYTLDDTSGDTQFVNGGTFTLEDGKNSLSFIATSANVYFKRGAGSVISTIDNVSVREVPAIKWAPHNLVTYSEDLTATSWVTTGTGTVANSLTVSLSGTDSLLIP
jgi:hypothetical protein